MSAKNMSCEGEELMGVASFAFILLLMHFSKVSDLVSLKAKKEKIMTVVGSLSCQDCEEAKQGFCDGGRVGFEVWNCMVEGVLEVTTAKGNFPSGSDRTIH